MKVKPPGAQRDHESTTISFSSEESLVARTEIFQLMQTYNATEGEKERSLGLFLRGSLLARMLAIGELYQKILDMPGMVLDVGTWRGQTAVLCENFRAIYEPLNQNRRIACFDTFEGYQGFSAKDKPTELHRDGTYGVGGSSYAEFLRELLILHEKSNANGHYYKKHKVIEGDVRQTLPQFFKDNPHEFVSLAFFDVNSYEPTHSAFKTVYERLVPGGIMAFWQLTRDTIPAEATHYVNEIMHKYPHKLYKTPTYHGLCYIQRC
jgi:hypothetical protein